MLCVRSATKLVLHPLCNLRLQTLVGHEVLGNGSLGHGGRRFARVKPFLNGGPFVRLMVLGQDRVVHSFLGDWALHEFGAVGQVGRRRR